MSFPNLNASVVEIPHIYVTGVSKEEKKENEKNTILVEIIADNFSKLKTSSNRFNKTYKLQG